MMDVTAVIDSDIAYASDTPAHVSVAPGGAAGNTAAWMASLGGTVTLVGCVGPDAHGREIAQRLQALGVDSRLRVGSGATGACVVLVDRQRERTMFPDTGANAELRATDIVAALDPHAHLHLSGYTLMNAATRDAVLTACGRAREIGATVSLDPASTDPLRRHLTLVRSVLEQVDLVIANQDEAAVLTGEPDAEVALQALRASVPCAVIKLGSLGVLAGDARGTTRRPAPAVTVQDTTGAGDAFTAGFLPAWLAGSGLAAAVDLGQSAAGMCVSRVGAGPRDS